MPLVRYKSLSKKQFHTYKNLIDRKKLDSKRTINLTNILIKRHVEKLINNRNTPKYGKVLKHYLQTRRKKALKNTPFSRWQKKITQLHQKYRIYNKLNYIPTLRKKVKETNFNHMYNTGKKKSHKFLNKSIKYINFFKKRREKYVLLEHYLKNFIKMPYVMRKKLRRGKKKKSLLRNGRAMKIKKKKKARQNYIKVTPTSYKNPYKLGDRIGIFANKCK